MAIFLKIIDNNEKKYYELKEPIILGRSSKADITITSKTSSGRHCQFSLKDSKVILKDLNSRNGTYVNGYKAEETYIYIGDKIKIGETYISISSKRMTSIEKAANSRIEEQASISELDMTKGPSSKRSVKMITAIHDLNTTQIDIDLMNKKKTKAYARRPINVKKKRPLIIRFFRWIFSFFIKSED